MFGSITKINQRFSQPVHIAPLVTFRVAFGAMMFISIIRFWLNGWITELYVKPSFYFPFFGWDWVQPLGSTGMHLIFALMAITSLCIMLGLFYRISTIIFLLAFTYVELIDITNYLNHYYFVSIVSFLLIWLPANRYYSLDCMLHPDRKNKFVPLWTIGAIRLQLAMVYFFAGLAKLNSDWLISALPMKIWLPAKSHLPIVGQFMYDEWVAYFFSWFGACYDLFIAFFLINKRTRPYAYVFVLGFHIATAIFFPGIGMFPYIMMVSSLIFFSSHLHRKIWEWIANSKKDDQPAIEFTYSTFAKKLIGSLLILHFTLQVIVPMRYIFYPGHLFWTEQGFRFSWRVMLMEKSGNTFFYIKEPSSGKLFEVNNADHLTRLQEKMMSTQPDMMVYYAHHLAKKYVAKGIKDPEVYVESYVALNGRKSTLFIDSTIDLNKQKTGFRNYDWILPFNDKK
ncbi:HTTM domain-containing protein [Ferruginibacter sp. SUN002]|uniref:HTTM domain-containing protein n=1 Tax=Ferruginibacter sp. SUN002 TaxID=2937789 RepID=UPI003D36E35E